MEKDKLGHFIDGRTYIIYSVYRDSNFDSAAAEVMEDVFYKFAKIYGYDYTPCFNKYGGWVRFYNSPIYKSFDCHVTFTNEHDVFNQLEKAFKER